MELKEPLISVEAASSEVKVAFVQTEGEEEQWLYCESAAKAAVASKMRASFQKRFEADMAYLAACLQKPKGHKKYEKILERIGRLKEKHKSISGCYEVIVQQSEDGKTASGITWTLIAEKAESRLNGHYFLRTNLKNIDPVRLWRLYGNLRTIEDALRFMKSSLGLRPVYHQKEQRVDAHLWITILAYHLIQSCMHELKKQGISDRWETIRNTLNSRMRITMQAKTAEGKLLYHRSTTRCEEDQARIYRAMSLSSQILKAKKVVV
jgi:transposase